MAANFDSQNETLWYFGMLSRTEAQKYLLGVRHGRFLVRDSKTCPGDYVLSVSENAKVSHYIINKLQSQKYKIGDQIFDNLPSLIEFYKIHYLDTTTLIEPCPRETSPPPQAQLPPPPPVQTPTPVQEEKYFKALFDFPGRDPDDLPFKKGETLILVREDEENWWTMKSMLSNKTGSVPVPYIEKCGNPNEVIYRPIVPHNGPVRALVIQQRIPSAYDPKALKLEVGDTVTVLEQNINGQWRGELNGREGTFPFTHVRILEEGSES